MLTNEEFFDSASGFYDSMINFNEGVLKRKELLKNYSSNIEKAADLGCGSGIDSIALALNGLEVTSFDISGEMIKKASENSEAFKVRVNFLKTSLDKIPEEYYNKFSIAVSLGNTFANLNLVLLKKTIENIYKILDNKGDAIIQLLNFKRILLKKERIVNINERNEYFYIRFYDFLQDSIVFNILRFNKNNLNERELISTFLYPHIAEDLIKYFKDTGFKIIEIFSSLDKAKFIPEESKDLVIIAKKYNHLTTMW